MPEIKPKELVSPEGKKQMTQVTEEKTIHTASAGLLRQLPSLKKSLCSELSVCMTIQFTEAKTPRPIRDVIYL